MRLLDGSGVNREVHAPFWERPAVRFLRPTQYQNHHVRDVVISEDASRIHEQPGIFARLRSIALNCMRASDETSISRTIYRNTLNFEHAVSVAHGRT